VDLGYWQAVYGVMVTASAFYAFVLTRASKGPQR
jgi:hypothetical protein